MKQTSKNFLMKSILVILFFTFTVNSFGQNSGKYEFAEIIVIQKVAKKKSEIKQIYLNSTTDSGLNKSEIEEITSNSNLLKFMDEKEWEYVERISSQPSNSGPVWINYTFRKKK